MRFSSCKLRFHDGRVRAVPAQDTRGCAFGGPGVDLLGEEAASVLGAAGPLLAVLERVQVGARVRAISLDFGGRRAIVSLAGERPGERPGVIRLVEGYLLDELLARGEALMAQAAPLVMAALDRRASESLQKGPPDTCRGGSG